MKLHELKIKQEYWEEVMSNNKNFELRKNDRDYQVGDLINFKVIIGEVIIPTESVYRITYVLKGVPEYGLSEDYCILGIKRMV